MSFGDQMIDEERHLLDARPKKLCDLRHQLVAVQKRGEIPMRRSPCPDGVDTDGEKTTRRETLEFLSMRLLLTVEPVVEQHRCARIGALRQRQQRNASKRKAALDHPSGHATGALSAGQRPLRFVNALRFSERSSFGRKSPSRRMSLPSK
jgi:hypothetical protein